MSIERTGAQIRFGVFADCQYCDCEIYGNRYYRNSKAKLNECILHFNRQKDLVFVTGLGDLIDRDFSSYETVNEILSNSKHKVFQVTGNHDLEVEKEYFAKVPEQLGLTNMYSSFLQQDWLFVFLDGNEISYLSADPAAVKQAEMITAKLKKEGCPNYHKWNGGIGQKQLKWLERQLKKADRKKLKVILLCHYPSLPLEAHSLWNHNEVLEVIKKYKCVKLWLNGHNHAGNYFCYQGIHFITLKGMVETKNENAFAEIILSNDTIEIKGFGREESRKLAIR